MIRSIRCFLTVLSITIFSSCVKDFLQKPNTTGTTIIQTVFSSTADAEQAIAAAYRDILVQNLWNGKSIDNGTLSGISGEMCYGETWASLARFVSAGFLPGPPFQNNRAQSTDNYFDNWSAIRECYIISENIDNVTDMDDNMKGYVKAEMKALIAYRYTGMLIRYGGVPVITKALQQTDTLTIPRASL